MLIDLPGKGILIEDVLCVHLHLLKGQKVLVVIKGP